MGQYHLRQKEARKQFSRTGEDMDSISDQGNIRDVDIA